jgi:hypothetical protein
MIRMGNEMILKIAGIMVVAGAVGLVAGIWWVTREQADLGCPVCD